MCACGLLIIQSSKHISILVVSYCWLTNSTKTSRTPRYMPGGEVCSRDLRLSGAIDAIQVATPAIEPAANILSGLRSSRLYVEYKPVYRCTNQNNKHRVPSALGSDFPQHPLIATKIECTARHIYTHVCHTLQYTHGQLETIPMQKLTGICTIHSFKMGHYLSVELPWFLCTDCECHLHERAVFHSLWSWYT